MHSRYVPAQHTFAAVLSSNFEDVSNMAQAVPDMVSQTPNDKLYTSEEIRALPLSEIDDMVRTTQSHLFRGIVSHFNAQYGVDVSRPDQIARLRLDQAGVQKIFGDMSMREYTEKVSATVNSNHFVFAFGDRTYSGNFPPQYDIVKSICVEFVLAGVSAHEAVSIARIFPKYNRPTKEVMSAFDSFYYGLHHFLDDYLDDVSTLPYWFRVPILDNAVVADMQHYSVDHRTLHPAIMQRAIIPLTSADFRYRCASSLTSRSLLHFENFLEHLFEIVGAFNPSTQSISDLFVISFTPVAMPCLGFAASDRLRSLAMVGDSIVKSIFLADRYVAGTFVPADLSDAVGRYCTNEAMASRFATSNLLSAIDGGGQKMSTKTVSTAFEAIIGCLYIHCGISPLHKFLKTFGYIDN